MVRVTSGELGGVGSSMKGAGAGGGGVLGAARAGRRLEGRGAAAVAEVRPRCGGGGAEVWQGWG